MAAAVEAEVEQAVEVLRDADRQGPELVAVPAEVQAALDARLDMEADRQVVRAVTAGSRGVRPVMEVVQVVQVMEHAQPVTGAMDPAHADMDTGRAATETVNAALRTDNALRTAPKVMAKVSVLVSEKPAIHTANRITGRTPFVYLAQ